MAGTHGVIQLIPLGAGVDSGQGGVAVQAHMAPEQLAGRLQLMASFLGLVLV